MKRFLAFALCGAMGLIAALPPALAQEKTVKACQQEWQANKTSNQALMRGAHVVPNDIILGEDIG